MENKKLEFKEEQEVVELGKHIQLILLFLY